MEYHAVAPVRTGGNIGMLKVIRNEIHNEIEI
jgi:hypothetical protein